MKRRTKTFWTKLPRLEHLANQLTWMGRIGIKIRIERVENVTVNQIKMKALNPKAIGIRRDREIEVEIGTGIGTESADIPMMKMTVQGVKIGGPPPRTTAIGRGMEMITKNQEQRTDIPERMRAAIVVTEAKKKGLRKVQIEQTSLRKEMVA